MSSTPDPKRRKLLIVLGAGAAAAAASAPVGAGLLAPVRTTTVREGEDYVDIGALDEILEGHPLRVVIRSDREDAWTTFRNVELGAAWILKGEGGQVTAFSSVCPHLGCAVDFDQKSDCFACPCHDGVFAKGGEKISGPAPRGLDRLQSRVENGRVLVRFAKVQS
jgi:Rieske Fe-S protein